MSWDRPGPSDLEERAYDVLTTFFAQHQDHALEIEILPPAIQPPDGFLMHEGLNVGIPKKILTLAFLEARRRFLASTKLNEPDSIVC